jgi:hypothetical protein
MNSIEAVSNPEKKGPQADNPTLRVFVKTGNSYELQSETPEYKTAIKEADKLIKAGKDVLVNEKDNPNIVHMKTNRNLDVDVGRTIKHNEAQGVPVRGSGEAVLASFYTKLPMDTKAYDERTAKEPVKAVVETVRDAVKEVAKTVAEPLGPEEKWRTPANDRPPALNQDAKELAKAAPDAPAFALGTKGPKAVFDKTGYALPDSVKGEYTVRDGKFHDRDSSALRFEDHGKKLTTPVEDRKVIAHMVEVASAKNWGALELKGTDNFKQIAWIEAQARGIETKGYKPNERDLEELAKIKQERGIPEKAVDAPAVPAKSNEIVAGERTPAKEAAEPVKAVKDLANAALDKTVIDPEPGKAKAMSNPAKDTPADPVKDKAAAEPSKDKPADPAKDKAAEPAKAQRPLSDEDQKKVNAATKVMEKAMAKLPEHTRNEAISKMTSMVRDGSLQLPTPKVTERAIDRPKPAPAPQMERAR